MPLTVEVSERLPEWRFRLDDGVLLVAEFADVVEDGPTLLVATRGVARRCRRQR
jgi:hypothetical protein